MVEVTIHDKNLRDALIDHWEDLPEEAIDELLATHRIEAAKAERDRIVALLRSEQEGRTSDNYALYFARLIEESQP